MFNRPHHQRIAKFLACLDAGFLSRAGCYFGGGTAITLSLGEYRVSADVDFLCSSTDGYRALRNTITNASLGSILSQPVELAREVRADRYGIRTFVRVDGVPIKFEIDSIDTGYFKAIELVSNSDYLASCLEKMQMDPALVGCIPELLLSSLPTAESSRSPAP